MSTFTSAEGKGLSFLPNVVLVKVGRVWGSGFVIDARKGLILTCSHVIKDASTTNPLSELVHVLISRCL